MAVSSYITGKVIAIIPTLLRSIIATSKQLAWYQCGKSYSLIARNMKDVKNSFRAPNPGEEEKQKGGGTNNPRPATNDEESAR